MAMQLIPSGISTFEPNRFISKPVSVSKGPLQLFSTARLPKGKVWLILGRKELGNIKIGTKDNPADDPARDVDLRKPEVAKG